MEEYLKLAALLITLLFTVCFAYQGVYTVVTLVRKMPVFTAKTLHRYGVLISARNEEAVIGELIRSIREQDYPADLIDIFVVADNCTDGTAAAARDAGAWVMERFNRVRVGKGYALNDLIKELFKNGRAAACDGFFIFDADNLLDPSYVTEMNKVFDNGYRVVTSYRNSKNYGDNWISAGYGLWFIREARYLNQARMILGTSCAVSGTGYVVAREILEEMDGWSCHLLTEDLQFTAEQILKGRRIGYARRAVFYDEQPTDFGVSFQQRMRWTKGILQVLRRYGKDLFVRLVTRRDFACYDYLVFLTQTLGLYLTCILTAVTLGHMLLVYGPGAVFYAAVSKWALEGLAFSYLSLIAVGGLAILTERKEIHVPMGRVLLCLLAFPLYMATYIPITFAATFGKVTWKPVPHKVVKTVREISKQEN